MSQCGALRRGIGCPRHGSYLGQLTQSLINGVLGAGHPSQLRAFLLVNSEAVTAAWNYFHAAGVGLVLTIAQDLQVARASAGLVATASEYAPELLISARGGVVKKLGW